MAGGTSIPSSSMNEGVSDAEAQDEQFLQLCRLLNDHGVHYLICGGYACILHGNLRMTEDVDLLVEENSTNYQKLLGALTLFGDGSAAELVESDIVENLVVKINDIITIDVSRRAWVVTYDEAIKNAKEEVIEGVRVPYLGLEDLIRSKQTYRDKDRLDIQMLLAKASPSAADRASSKPSTKGCLPSIGLIILALLGYHWLFQV